MFSYSWAGMKGGCDCTDLQSEYGGLDVMEKECPTNVDDDCRKVNPYPK